MKRIILLTLLFMLMVGIGYTIGRVHNLENEGRGLVGYCIGLERDYVAHREGLLECVVEKAELQREATINFQMYLNCKDD